MWVVTGIQKQIIAKKESIAIHIAWWLMLDYQKKNSIILNKVESFRLHFTCEITDIILFIAILQRGHFTHHEASCFDYRGMMEFMIISHRIY